MEYKAVIFDLFETLITEWGHEKYTRVPDCGKSWRSIREKT